MANVVAIVGRPNVGKSTLFNRLVEERKAIMDDESGVTRDRHYGIATWSGKYFNVIDTGGYVPDTKDFIEKSIRKQVSLAIDEANAILFLLDCKTGLTAEDKEFAQFLREIDKPIMVVANKADNYKLGLMANEFYSLGLSDQIYSISSTNGAGTGDLLDDLIKYLPEEGEQDPYAGIPKVAFVGRPNVGKSSLLNALLNRERAIVTDIAGTTRDSLDSEYNLYGKKFILIDTAGIRKKSKVKENLEFYSVIRTIKAIESCNICVLLLDATRGFEAQDMNILTQAIELRKGIIILVNKWDLIEKDSNTINIFTKMIQEKLAAISYIPIIFGSALEKVRLHKLIDTVSEVYQNLTKKVSTSALNQHLLKEIERNPPPAFKGKYIKIKYITQLNGAAPSFILFCNFPKYIKDPYKRFIENKLRDHFDFRGVPIKLIFRKK